MKRETLELSEEWRGLVGNLTLTGSIIIWGSSGNGKTRFAVKFANYLSTMKRVLYNSIEEGTEASLVRAFKESGVGADNESLSVVGGESLEDLRLRLARRRSVDIVFIDSLQHWRISEVQYKELVTEFPEKLFVFVSHAEGREPAKAVGQAVRYDANVKIYVDRFVASAVSRFEGSTGQRYVVWEERARELYGTEFDAFLGDS